MHITGPSQKSVDDAKSLAENLIIHVKKDYEEFLALKSRPVAHIPAINPVLGFAQYPQGPFPPFGFQNPVCLKLLLARSLLIHYFRDIRYLEGQQHMLVTLPRGMFSLTTLAYW